MRKLGGVPIKGLAVAEACMTFADVVEGRRLLQPDNALLDVHMSNTARIGGPRTWQFERGVDHTNGAWAAAGAVHLALNAEEPAKPAPRRVIVPDVDM